MASMDDVPDIAGQIIRQWKDLQRSNLAESAGKKIVKQAADNR